MEQLPSKAPGETKIVTFDFTKELATGATLTGTPTVTQSLVSGSGTVTLGGVTLATPLVQVPVSAGTDQAVHELKCSANASNGEVHEIFARLPIGKPGV